MGKSVDSPLQIRPQTDAVKVQIVSTYWNAQCTANDQLKKCRWLELYFDYYKEQTTIALHELGRHASVRSHRDVMEIVELLKSQSSRQQILAELMTANSGVALNHSCRKLDSSIDLGIRLLTMVDVRRIPNSYMSQKPLNLETGSFREFFTFNSQLKESLSPNMLNQRGSSLHGTWTGLEVLRFGGQTTLPITCA